MCELIKMCLFFPKKCNRTSEVFQINKQYLYMFDSQVSDLFLGGLNKYWVTYIGNIRLDVFKKVSLPVLKA